MEVVLVACAVLMDVNACSSPCHPDVLLHLTLTYGPPHTVAKFPGVYARLKSVLCEDGWLVSSLKLVVLRIRRRRDSVAVLKV